MPKLDYVEMFGEGWEGWAWCLHCERVYKFGEFRLVRDRLVGDLQMCPYEDCDGDTVMDIQPWEGVRSLNPGYPEEPERGKVYPLYGSPKATAGRVGHRKR